MAGIVATAEIDIAAEPDRVWETLTDPAAVKQWMFGTDLETDWQVGSPIVWKGEYEGKSYEDKGEVLVYDAPQRLSVTHFSPTTGQDDVPENYHTLVYDAHARRRRHARHPDAGQQRLGGRSEALHRELAACARGHQGARRGLTGFLMPATTNVPDLTSDN